MNAFLSPYTEYREVGIQTSTPGKLVCMLYDGMVRFLNQTKEEMRKKDTNWREKVCENLIKTQNIVTLLLASLDNKNGGEISKNLSKIYLYLLEQLLEAGIEKKEEKIELILKIIFPLKEAFEHAEENLRRGNFGA